ncbi:MAG: hypothetical protein GY719_28825 [bacterium]|nr:hypothetical protein [bacterium]
MRTIQREDLEGWRRELLDAARGAAETAHCDYSHYPVGAAVRIKTPAGEERIVTGNNYELATFRSVCAERHAIHQAYAEHSVAGEDGLVRPEVTAVAVYCAVSAAPQQPCGDCRQALHEVNPDIEVIAAAGPGSDGTLDPRVTLTTVRALLPHGFEVESLAGELAGSDSGSRDARELEQFVLHLPKPGELKTAATSRPELLAGVRHLLVVGSPRRARRIARLAHEELGARRNAESSCYCDLTVPGRDESGREYAVYGVELPGGAKVAVASHGVGKAGVEIVLSELPALIAMIQGGEAPDLRAAIRCGTRGTLSQVPPAAIALSTRCHDESLAPIDPSAAWLDKIRAAAAERGMTRVADDEIDSHGDDWGDPTTVLAEGPGISTSFFWHGQGRPLYRAGEGRVAGEVRAFERRERAALLSQWTSAGVRWIEMEDFTVLRIAEMCGIPAVSLGAVLGQRRRPDGRFQLAYDKKALETSELIPAELALAAIRADS